MDSTMTQDPMANQTTGGGAIGEKINNLTQNASEMMENEPRNQPRMDHREGRIARSIEQQTARLPSDMFLWAALGSIGISLTLELMGEEKKANFVGHWAPTFLILGLYNKLVKLHGSEGV